MKKIILFLLVSIASYSQNAKIQVKVDSIYYIDTNYKNREYYINYQVTNTTDKDISFFLIPKKVATPKSNINSANSNCKAASFLNAATSP